MPERGIVKFFNKRAGWGFIARAAAPDVFVHYDRIQGTGFRTLEPGQGVEFRLRVGPRGPYAEAVTPLPVAGEVPEAPRAKAS